VFVCVCEGRDFTETREAVKQRAMQNQTQAHTEPNPATTSTSEQQLNTAAEPAHSQADAHDKESRSTAPTETETIIAPETPASMAVTAPAESESGAQSQAESCGNTGEMDWDLAAKPSVPTESVPDANAKPGCDGQKAKKQEKGDGRKYVPSKKAMVDPLKMDMSKPLVMPLTCKYFTLHVHFVVQLSKQAWFERLNTNKYTLITNMEAPEITFPCLEVLCCAAPLLKNSADICKSFKPHNLTENNTEKTYQMLRLRKCFC